jgi:outer membrane protein TolC
MHLTKAIAMTALFVLVLHAETLSPQKAVQAALAHHPNVKRLQLAVQKAQRQIEAQHSDILPHITLDAGYAPYQTFAMPQNGTFHTIDDDAADGGVTLSQTLWDFSKTSALTDAARLDKKITELSLHDFKSFLAYKVKSLYALAVVQNLAVQARRKDYETKKALYAQTLSMVKQGLKTKADASRFLSALYASEDGVAQAKSAYEKALVSLRLYTGLSLRRPKFDKNFLLRTPRLNPRNFEAQILRANTKLKQDTLTLKKADAYIDSAHASRFGALRLTASHRRFDTLNAYDSDYVGIRYNVSLYSGGKLSAAEEEARIARAMAAQNVRNDTLTLLEEVRTLLTDYRRYTATIKARKAQLRAAKRHQAMQEARYKEGLATYIEALDAAAQTLNARLALLEAYYQRRTVYDRLLYLKGEIR